MIIYNHQQEKHCYQDLDCNTLVLSVGLEGWIPVNITWPNEESDKIG